MSGHKGRAGKVRTLLAAIKGRLAYKGATSEQIVAVLEKDHPKAIASESRDLIRIALIKLASEAGRSGPKAKVQLEIFVEYDLPKMVVMTVIDSKGRKKRLHKAVGALTIVEGWQYVTDHSPKGRSRRDSQVKELARLIDDVAKYGEPETSTIDDCWKASQAAAI
jgi:hypothetical protein